MTIDIKKCELLKLAEIGDPKPETGSRLHNVLRYYTDSAKKSFDSEFKRKLQELRPEWFIKRCNKSRNYKYRLLRMANLNLCRPNHKTKLSSALCRFTCKSSSSYDVEFDIEMKRIVPDWFDCTRAIEKKKKLLLLAASGSKRLFGLYEYTCRVNKSYDAEFDGKIRELRPELFVDSVVVNKMRLLDLASLGEDRPPRGTILGNALNSYSYDLGKSYDGEFVQQMHNLCPEWFREKNSVVKNKLQIINLSYISNSSIKVGDKLYRFLRSYTCKTGNVYDAKFDGKIRELRPDWFDRGVTVNKRKLLEIRCGDKKPSQATKLGRALHFYTSNGHKNFDIKFNKRIRLLQSGWF